MRFLKWAVLLVVVLAVGVGVISAQDGEVPAISDGRVNSTDLAAKAVVYCEFAYPDKEDPNAGVLDHIEVWGVNPEDYFEQVIYVTAEEIDAAGLNSTTSTVLAIGNGYSLYRETDGSFTVTSPGDAEGKVYSFNWERGDQNC
jgi:hypothetical protein